MYILKKFDEYDDYMYTKAVSESIDKLKAKAREEYRLPLDWECYIKDRNEYWTARDGNTAVYSISPIEYIEAKE